MVAYQHRCTRIVVQIDTEQLPCPQPPKPTFGRKNASSRRHFVDLGGKTSAREGLAGMTPFASGVGMSETATRRGHQIFTNELTRFADRTGDARTAALIAD